VSEYLNGKRKMKNNFSKYEGKQRKEWVFFNSNQKVCLLVSMDEHFTFGSAFSLKLMVALSYIAALMLLRLRV
jgi:tRNA G26 N,N-dimethylase Trm1